MTFLLSQEELDKLGWIYCGTRTGKKAHLAQPGSSVTVCGHWLKSSASLYKLSPASLTATTPAGGRVLCERCAAAVPHAIVTVHALRLGS